MVGLYAIQILDKNITTILFLLFGKFLIGMRRELWLYYTFIRFIGSQIIKIVNIK